MIRGGRVWDWVMSTVAGSMVEDHAAVGIQVYEQYTL